MQGRGHEDDGEGDDGEGDDEEDYDEDEDEEDEEDDGEGDLDDMALLAEVAYLSWCSNLSLCCCLRPFVMLLSLVLLTHFQRATTAIPAWNTRSNT